MPKILRMIPNSEFKAIRDGSYAESKVPVYYAFTSSYRWDVEHINEIVNVIRKEHPGIRLSDMNVRHIDKKMSIQHAEYTAVQVMVLTSCVKLRLLDDYTTL